MGSGLPDSKFEVPWVGTGETATFMIRNGCLEVSAMCNILVVSSLNFCTSQSHRRTGKPIYLATDKII